MTLEFKAWGMASLFPPDTAWDRLNLRRLAFAMRMDRVTPPELKLSRRSRRRWRGRGGEWVYPPKLTQLAREAGLL